MTTTSTRGEPGWQSEKTLSECMRYMLDNEMASDVCFEVGPQDGATVEIRAHRCVLMARSAVFEAMFNSGMTECRSGSHAKIRVEDIDPDIFKALLLYIYSEDVPVNVESAVPLMYAANKYLLPKLVKECGNCLSVRLNVNSVIHVLEQSSLFEASELKDKCLQLITKNARTIFAGAEILSASKQTLETILDMDLIQLKETVIYETCLAWAKHQLQIHRSIEIPTDQQIREILGDLLYKIRFPIMGQTEFAEISEGKSILTGEEKASVYYFLATEKRGSQLMFSTEQRICKEEWIERSVICLTRQWETTRQADAISFTSNQDILLTGIGLYTGYNGEGYNVDVEILQSTKSLFKKRLTVPATGESNQFKVLLDEAITVEAGILHSIKALSHDNIGHYGDPCTAVCTKDKVTFTFSKHPDSHHSTTEISGQIPRLYFCCY